MERKGIKNRNILDFTVSINAKPNGMNKPMFAAKL